MENSKSKNSNTGYKGIYFNKLTGKFRARLYLSINNKDTLYNVGCYSTLKDAVKAREDFIKSLF